MKCKIVFKLKTKKYNKIGQYKALSKHVNKQGLSC